MQALDARIPPPRGFERAAVPVGSFASWLRGLPLKPGRPPVSLYDGRPKPNQEAHAAVIDLDVGRGDLQQCADAVIRLRAEYLYAQRVWGSIIYRFTNGTPAAFEGWAAGFRPQVRGNRVEWKKTARPDRSYSSFRRYLETVFTYAGSASLERELRPVSSVRSLRIGDVFIQGGAPGHAVLVIDLVEEPLTGRRKFLIAQSYMPAQEMHVLRNPARPPDDPWYELADSRPLITPEWEFKPGALRTWSDAR